MVYSVWLLLSGHWSEETCNGLGLFIGWGRQGMHEELLWGNLLGKVHLEEQDGFYVQKLWECEVSDGFLLAVWILRVLLQQSQLGPIYWQNKLSKWSSVGSGMNWSCGQISVLKNKKWKAGWVKIQHEIIALIRLIHFKVVINIILSVGARSCNVERHGLWRCWNWSIEASESVLVYYFSCISWSMHHTETYFQ